MHLRTYLIATLAATVLVPATAQASPTIAQSLEIAERWVAANAPSHVNHCAGGRLSISFDNSTATASAHGWVPDGRGGFRWDHTRCLISIATDQSAEQICGHIAHEMMHFVLGPEHVGPLVQGSYPHDECYGPTVLPRAAQTLRHDGHYEDHKPYTVKVKKARTRKQIARSMRYKRLMAKIRARRALRNTSRQRDKAPRATNS